MNEVVKTAALGAVFALIAWIGGEYLWGVATELRAPPEVARLFEVWFVFVVASLSGAHFLGRRT